MARARGMSEIAKASGITREALYRALRPDAMPRFDMIGRVCTALGVGIVNKWFPDDADCHETRFYSTC